MRLQARHVSCRARLFLLTLVRDRARCTGDFVDCRRDYFLTVTLHFSRERAIRPRQSTKNIHQPLIPIEHHIKECQTERHGIEALNLPSDLQNFHSENSAAARTYDALEEKKI